MKKETIIKLVDSLDADLSGLSTANPGFYANIYAEKYNIILTEVKKLYKDDSFVQAQKELDFVKDNSAELDRLFRNVNISVKQLKAYLEEEK